MAYLIHKEHLRQRIIGRLLLGTPNEPLKRFFERGCKWHATWRWGTIGDVLDRLLQLRNVLPKIWDPNKFLTGDLGGQGQGQAVSEEDRDALNLSVLTQTIRCPKWWGYSLMLGSLHQMIGDFGSWGEGCPCHDFLARADRSNNEEGSSTIERYVRMQEMSAQRAGDGVGFRCPMRGKRAVELARGDLQDIISVVSERKFVELLSELPAAIAPDEVGIMCGL